MDNKSDAVIDLLCDIFGTSVNKLKEMLIGDMKFKSKVQNLLVNIEDIKDYIKGNEMNELKVSDNIISLNTQKEQQATSIEIKQEHSDKALNTSQQPVKLSIEEELLSIEEKLIRDKFNKTKEKLIPGTMYSDETLLLIQELEELSTEEWLLDKSYRKLNRTLADTEEIADIIIKKY